MTAQQPESEDYDEEAVVIHEEHSDQIYKQETDDSITKSGDGVEMWGDTAGDPNETTTHTNSLFNGHLMKWKYNSEEGTPFIRLPAFFGALGLIGTAIATLVIDQDSWSPHSIVISVCIGILSCFIIVLEARFCATSPLNARAHLRNILTKNLNLFRYQWGRGLLYFVAGVLSCCEARVYMLVTGSFMVALGLLAFVVGLYCTGKYIALQNALTDEAYLMLMFNGYDYDGDGFIDATEFSYMLADAGMELDDRYTLKAFNVIDSDGDRKICFKEFQHWWSTGHIERGRRYPDIVSEGSESEFEQRKYHRMA
jgi:EF-hand domain pair